MPKRDLLAFHVAARLQRPCRLVGAERGQHRIALLLLRREQATRQRTKMTSIAASTAQPCARVADHPPEE